MADDRDPAWSPDGRQLAFTSKRDGNWDIYILDLPSGTVRRLTYGLTHDAAPSWSPDGQWLVYESLAGDNLDLFIIKSDGTNAPIRVTEHPRHDFSPSWGPSGRHIAFTSLRSGNRDIFIMSLDTASDALAVNLTLSPDKNEDDPIFHPDGESIAYGDDSTGFELVYALPLKNYRRDGEPLSLGKGRHPTWSPDGEELLYSYTGERQDYLLASALDAWRVAPQAFVSPAHLDDPSWTAVTLPRELNGYLQMIAQAANPPLFTETIGEPATSGPAYLLSQVAVDAPAPYLNDRVDQSFAALRLRVIEDAGWDFLGQVDSMYESLALRPLPGQSARNWNKAGRAFDFYYRSALALNPQVEVVREDRDNETYWRIYIRPTAQDGTQGEPLLKRSWDFRARYGADPQYYDEGGKIKEQLPEGYYIDFTALAADYGWTPVPANPNWRTYFPDIRFWHYENQQGLAWEQAMLEIYTVEEFTARFGN